MSYQHFPIAQKCKSAELLGSIRLLVKTLHSVCPWLAPKTLRFCVSTSLAWRPLCVILGEGA